MKQKLYAFWKYDVPPYVLGGEVTEIKSNGRVCVNLLRAIRISHGSVDIDRIAEEISEYQKNNGGKSDDIDK